MVVDSGDFLVDGFYVGGCVVDYCQESLKEDLVVLGALRVG